MRLHKWLRRALQRGPPCLRTFCWCLKSQPAVSLGMRVHGILKRKDNAMILVEINTDQDLGITVTPLDGHGNPAPVEVGSVRAFSDDPSRITDATVEADGSLRCETTGWLGQVLITVSADADIGAGVDTISEQIQVTISALHAKNLGVGVAGIPKAL